MVNSSQIAPDTAALIPESLPGNAAQSVQPAAMYPSVEQVLQVCPQTDINNVRRYLPLILRAMAEKNLLAPEQLIGVIATIYTEVTNFAPIREDGGSSKSYSPFFGRGFVQLTHLSNYQSASRDLGLTGLVENPDIALQPENAARIFMWYWVGSTGNNPAAAATRRDWERVRRAVNGGVNGWDVFKPTVDRALQVFTRPLDPDALGVVPTDGGYGLGCADPGSGSVQTINGLNPQTQGAALAHALGLTARAMSQAVTFRATLNPAADPKILDLDAQKTFELRGEKAVATTVAQSEAGNPVLAERSANQTEVTEGNQNELSKDFLNVKMGSQVYNSIDGDILDGTEVTLSTDRFGTAWIYFDDPDSSIFAIAKQQLDVEVEVGFVDGHKRNIYIGKVLKYGRILPTTTVVYAADTSVQIQQQQTSGAVYSADVPQGQEAQRVITGSEQGRLLEQLSKLLEADLTGESRERAIALVQRMEILQATSTPETKAAVQRLREAIATSQPSNVIRGALQSIQVAAPTATTTSSPALDSALQQIAQMSEVAGTGSIASAAQQNTLRSSDLRFSSDTNLSLAGGSGYAIHDQSQMRTMVDEAAERGNVIVARGNTVHEVGPGQGASSGLVLDYVVNPSAFVGEPRILKRTPVQLNGGFGMLRVLGWNGNDKRPIDGTVVVPGAAPPHPTGSIQVPDWGQVKLSDPVFEGCIYTWADVTKNGTRVPTREVMQNAVAIARIIQGYTDQTVGRGNRWTITSWYRDPESNRRVNGATSSQHLTGSAVDFYFPNFEAFFNSIRGSYPGGLAQKPGSFAHLDTYQTNPPRRWTY